MNISIALIYAVIFLAVTVLMLRITKEDSEKMITLDHESWAMRNQSAALERADASMALIIRAVLISLGLILFAALVIAFLCNTPSGEDGPNPVLVLMSFPVVGIHVLILDRIRVELYTYWGYVNLSRLIKKSALEEVK